MIEIWQSVSRSGSQCDGLLINVAKTVDRCLRIVL